MQELYCESIGKILQEQKKLEKELNVKISNKDHLLFVDGKAEDEYLAIQVIEAMTLGFTTTKALLLTQEGFILEKIYIRGITQRRDLARIRGRIIGTNGKTKKTIESLGDCHICVHENTVGVIGFADEIRTTITALEALIRGKKQTKTYSYLEEARSQGKFKLNEDLGLRKVKKTKKTKKKKRKQKRINLLPAELIIKFFF